MAGQPHHQQHQYPHASAQPAWPPPTFRPTPAQPYIAPAVSLPAEEAQVTVGTVAVVAMLTLGAAAVAFGVFLLHAGASFAWNGSPPKCDGQIMSPGDVCLSWGRRGNGGYDYAEGIRNGVESGRFLRSVAGMLAGGLGAALLYAAMVLAGARSARLAAIDAVAVLAVAIAVLLTLNSGFALFAAVAAAAVVVKLSSGVGVGFGRAVYVMASLAALGGAAGLVIAGLDYDAGRLSGAGTGDNVTLATSDLLLRYGDLLRYGGALIAVLVVLSYAQTGLNGDRRRAVLDEADLRSTKSDTQLERENQVILTPLMPRSLRSGLWLLLALAALAGSAWVGVHGGGLPAWVGAAVLLGLAARFVGRALTGTPAPAATS